MMGVSENSLGALPPLEARAFVLRTAPKVVALRASIANAIRRSAGLCKHEWGDDEDFVSCFIVTIGDGYATNKPHTIQTRQWCLKCDANRRKPGSARSAQGMAVAAASETGTGSTEGNSPVGNADAPDGGSHATD